MEALPPLMFHDTVDEVERHNEAVREHRAARAAQLAAMPRCEIAGCRSRATSRAGIDRVGICGRHLARAQSRAARAGIFGVGIPWTREQITQAAT